MKQSRFFIYATLLSCNVLVLLLSYFFPSYLKSVELPFFISLMILSGIPHGATDYYIYQFCQEQRKENDLYLWTFIGTYILAMLAYLILWMLWPTFSLTIFILMAAFHFGQTHWNALKERMVPMIKHSLMLCWGSTIILSALIANWKEVSSVLQHMLVDQGLPYYWILFGTTVVCTCATMSIMLFYKKRQLLSTQDLLLEVTVFICLLLLFFQTSLLIGFGIFFGLWHSIISIEQEIITIRKKKPSFSLKQFTKAAWPFSLVSLLGIALLLTFNYHLNGYQSSLLLFFIAVSTLTFPHVYFRSGFQQL